MAQNVGAQKKERVQKTFLESAKLLLLFGLLCSAALFLLALLAGMLRLLVLALVPAQ